MGKRLTALLLLTSAVALPPVVHAQNFAPANGWSTEVAVIAEGSWNGQRTADGQPDIAGFWSNTISNQSNFTDPQAGPPGEPSDTANLPRDQRAPSRVSDPADGQIPYLPAARALQERFAANFANPVEEQYIEPLARCAPSGVPKSFYWHGFEIRQYSGHVFLWFDSGWRIIRLDQNARHLPDTVKLWNGDSIGYWEGNTLHVSVRNINGKALFGRYGDFISENGTVEERYVFQPDGSGFNYIATFTDPTVYSRPWTATVPVRRYTTADEPGGWHFDVSRVNRAGPVEYEHLERICVENNGPFGGGAVGVPSNEPLISR
ncbi:MAG: hypothetical protein V4647_02945 [Pseudomonadota bacterium]